MTRKIKPELVCELPVHAASGLVITRDHFYIVADDELSLLIRDKKGKCSLYVLWEGELPEDVMERKKIKPDLESLFLFEDKLYAVPSGSKKNRTMGARIKLDSSGKILGHEDADFEGLFKKLKTEIDDLNIEGAFSHGKDLFLFQRGNGKEGINAMITVKDWPSTKFSVKEIKLPLHKNVPLTITDATMVEDEIYFLAVAEATESTYLDGEILGAFFGKLRKGEAQDLTQLDMKGKPEGLASHSDGYFYIVTDDDSRDIPSRLLRFLL